MKSIHLKTKYLKVISKFSCKSIWKCSKTQENENLNIISRLNIKLISFFLSILLIKKNKKKRIILLKRILTTSTMSLDVWTIFIWIKNLFFIIFLSLLSCTDIRLPDVFWRKTKKCNKWYLFINSSQETTFYIKNWNSHVSKPVVCPLFF